MRLHKHKWIEATPPKDSPFADGTIFWVCKRCKPPRIEFKDPRRRKRDERKA